MTFQLDFPPLIPLDMGAPMPPLGLLRNGSIVSPVPVGPEYDQRFYGRAGVYFPDGSFVSGCNVVRGSAFEIRPKKLKGQPQLRLAGRHLYAGQICRHFGHFLVESLARLWPLMKKDLGIESVLFIIRRPNSSRELVGFQKAMFKELGIDIPITIVDQPMVVEELIIPEQGFSDQELVGGSPVFRHYIRHHFGANVAAEGPDRLYLSRDGLKMFAGRFFNEEIVSSYLAQEGYEEFRPEAHDYKTQIARYKAAKQIIGVEGSAFHLFGFVGTQDQRVAIINRRSDGITSRNIAWQLQNFCAIKADVVGHIIREWDCRGLNADKMSSRSLSELDLSALSQELHRLGYKSDKRWRNPPVNFARKITRLSALTGRKYQQVFGPIVDLGPA